jgi:hypothetical protein
MTAQSKARLIVEKEGVHSQAPVKGSTTIYQGALVVMSSGVAIPGKTATGLVTLGVATETVENAGSDGAVSVEVKRGTFKFFNDSGAAVTSADIGKTAYVVDDQTVSKSDGAAGEDPATRSAAGTIIDVDSDGVWVRVGL